LQSEPKNSGFVIHAKKKIMFDQYLKKLTELRQANVPFVIATVVRREAPSSGKTGDRALIEQNGELWGWIGGGCTKGIMLKEAREAIMQGTPRLVRVSPGVDEKTSEGIKDYRMTCQSGGSVDVYIEPVMPKPHLIIMGKTAIAQALARMAHVLDYKVTIMAMGATAELFPTADELKIAFNLAKVPLSAQRFVVVCTQGEQDEMALKAALKDNNGYVAFVGSRKKREAVFEYLRTSGVAEEELAKVKSPAGIDIHAKTPAEVAVSILAEIIEYAHKEPVIQTFEPIANDADSKFYINPVCGIPVDKTAPKHIIAYKGENVYFCCDGCKIKFEAEPEKYMASQLSN
jgi:xanthine dehydrogenase accessory factor